jgi:hypothetical protein
LRILSLGRKASEVGCGVKKKKLEQQSSLTVGQSIFTDLQSIAFQRQNASRKSKENSREVILPCLCILSLGRKASESRCGVKKKKLKQQSSLTVRQSIFTDLQ